MYCTPGVMLFRSVVSRAGLPASSSIVNPQRVPRTLVHFCVSHLNSARVDISFLLRFFDCDIDYELLCWSPSMSHVHDT